MEKLDLLKKEIKIALMFFLFFICSCNSSFKEGGEMNADTYVIKNYNSYADIHSTLNDSINIYVDSLLKCFLGQYLWPWEVDSLVCINSNKTKLVTTINSSSGSCKECVSDEIIKLLGKKIDGVWYFFESGESLIVPRDMYGKDEMHTLCFHELSQIARKEFLGSAIIKNAAGEYVVNDKWIDANFYKNLFGGYESKVEYDSVHWNLILEKWKVKIDTNEYKPFRRKVTPKPAA
ncbi:MAG: hypothetical protein ABI315_06525 [Bacteroidia bacterium]